MALKPGKKDAKAAKGKENKSARPLGQLRRRLKRVARDEQNDRE